MSPDRYAGWVTESASGFADQQVAAGVMPPQEAREYAAGELAKLLTEGLATPGHHIWSAYDDEAEVGYLWLRVRQLSDGIAAFVLDVAVAPSARRRGYGRAVMLIAEDQARAFGATAIRLNVFGHNAAARSLYEDLGYETASTMMTRRLDRAEPLTSAGGPVLRLEATTQEQFDAYRAQAEASYATSIADSGMMPVEEAHEKSRADFGQLLPDGLDTADQFFWTAYDGQREIGLIRLNITERSDGLHALFGYDFLVRQELRRQGYGRAIMVAGEQVCRDRGVVSVGLNVFGHNRGARALYEQMGFEVSASLMKKDLG